MNINNENIVYVSKNSKSKTKMFVLYLLLLLLWNLMYLLALVLNIAQESFIGFIAATLFTLFLDIATCICYLDYKGKSILLSENNVYIMKQGQLKKVIPCKDVKIWSDGKLNTVIYDKNMSKERCYAIDTVEIEQSLLNKGYDINLPPKKSDKYIIALIIVGIICFQFYKGYSYKQQNRPFSFRLFGIPIYSYTPPKTNQILPNIQDVSEYMNYIQNTIKSNWKPNNIRGSVVITYSILENGQITNIKIKETSHNENLDNLAINVLKEIIIPPLPNELKKNGSINMQYTFYSK